MVFTLENDPTADPFTVGATGKADSRFVAIPTQTLIKDCKEQRRELMQYRLNLTHHEKQELWRLLDEDMMKGSHGHFNFQTNSCLTSTILNMKQCLIGEFFEWGPLEYPRTLNDGDFLRYSLRNAPWTEFLGVTFSGTAYRQYSREEERMTPQTIIPLLRKARFVNAADTTTRPVISDEGTMLVKGEKEKPSAFTPTVVFGVLFLLTLLITLAERKLRWQRLAHGFDLLLFGFQTLVALVLIYVIVSSEVFVSRWNWYLVAFFPVPLLFLLTIQRKAIEPKCWLAYSAILLLFILATPFLGELDLPHQMITTSLLVRSFNRYSATRDNK